MCYLYIIYTDTYVFFAIRVRNTTVWFAAILHEAYVIGSGRRVVFLSRTAWRIFVAARALIWSRSRGSLMVKTAGCFASDPSLVLILFHRWFTSCQPWFVSFVGAWRLDMHTSQFPRYKASLSERYAHFFLPVYCSKTRYCIAWICFDRSRWN